ncbi:MAG: hypothetical protein R3B09_24275 [Nannocystaceae bacterium]
MLRIALPGLVVGLALAAAGVVTCVTAAPNDPRSFPALEDLLILGGVAVLALSARREPVRARQGDRRGDA